MVIFGELGYAWECYRLTNPSLVAGTVHRDPWRADTCFLPWWDIEPVPTGGAWEANTEDLPGATSYPRYLQDSQEGAAGMGPNRMARAHGVEGCLPNWIGSMGRELEGVSRASLHSPNGIKLCLQSKLIESLPAI